MENIMNIDPGLMFWTLVNFGIFLFILIKLGTKPIINALNARETSIQEAIETAEKARDEAQKLLQENQKKLAETQNEVMALISKGKEQADKIIQKATDEADVIRKKKVEDAQREIQKTKEAAIKELRKEVADLVVIATEKILDESLDKDKHLKLIDKYIDEIPNN